MGFCFHLTPSALRLNTIKYSLIATYDMSQIPAISGQNRQDEYLTVMRKTKPVTFATNAICTIPFLAIQGYASAYPESVVAANLGAPHFGELIKVFTGGVTVIIGALYTFECVLLFRQNMHLDNLLKLNDIRESQKCNTRARIRLVEWSIYFCSWLIIGLLQVLLDPHSDMKNIGLLEIIGYTCVIASFIEAAIMMFLMMHGTVLIDCRERFLSGLAGREINEEKRRSLVQQV